MDNITLLHGDCLELLPTIPDCSIDAIICDPPYGTTACRWDSVIPFEPMWRELKRVIKPRGAIVLFGSQPFTSALVMSNPRWFRHIWTWDKVMVSGIGAAGKMPLKTHEDVIVFGDTTCRYYPQYTGIGTSPFGRITHPTSLTNGDRNDANTRRGVGYPKSIIRYPRPNNLSGGGLHPTQKPVALMEYLIRTYTNESETVLDFTMGSGTTGVACLNTGRRFIGIERDDHYFQVASDRIHSTVAPLIIT